MQTVITQAERNRISVVFSQIAEQVEGVEARWAALSNREQLQQWEEYLAMTAAGEAVFHPFHRVLRMAASVN